MTSCSGRVLVGEELCLLVNEMPFSGGNVVGGSASGVLVSVLLHLVSITY